MQRVFDDLIVPFEDYNKVFTLLLCLFTIANSSDFPSDVTFTAKALLENWCKFENIMITFIYCDLFNVSTPASKYLQTSGLSYLVANQMVNTLHKKICAKRDNFEVLHNNAVDFVCHLNE